jgi:hypothetical protein
VESSSQAGVVILRGLHLQLMDGLDELRKDLVLAWSERLIC